MVGLICRKPEKYSPALAPSCVGSASTEVVSAHGKQDNERGETDRTYLVAYRNLGLVFRVENANERVEGILILSRE